MRLAAFVLVASLVCACRRAPREPAGSAASPAVARAVSSNEPEPPPQGAAADAFVARFLARLRAQHPEIDARAANGLAIEVVVDGGVRVPTYLTNLWAACRDTTECGPSMDRFISVISDLGQVDRSLRRENVRAVLRRRGAFEEIAAQARSEGRATPDVTEHPFVGDLRQAFVIDTPDTIASLSPENQRQLGLSDADLQRVALENLARALPSIPYQPAREGSRLFLVHAGDSYENARVLLHDLWEPITHVVRGDLVVTAPARDVVLFTGTGESEYPMLRAIAERVFHSEPHPISPTVLRWTPHGWLVVD